VTRVLDTGYVRLVETWGSDERIVEAARMSTGGGFRGWPGDERLLRYLWDHRHTSPFEMAGLIVEVRAPLFVFREWHRHRTQSFNELSGRYVAMPDDDYTPTLDRVMASQSTTNRQAQGSGAELTEGDAHAWLDELGSLYDHAQQVYASGLRAGVARELARLAVPVARYSVMRASATLRNWLGFLSLRQDESAQWEIRQYAHAVAALVVEHFPRTAAVAALKTPDIQRGDE